MAETDIKSIACVNDKIVAMELQRLLEEKGIYSLVHSDDPAESIMNTYFGSAFKSNYTIQINVVDLNPARSILDDNGYGELLME